MIVLQIIFWCAALLLLHSYLFYPLILKLLSAGKKQQSLIYKQEEELPFISILLAVYNEERVMEQKIASTFYTSYPLEKIEWIIGSDQSTDNTEAIISQHAKQFPQIRLIRFEERTGKIAIMNELSKQASATLLVFTDANVFFARDTLYELVKHYRNPAIALVAGNILNPVIKADGISRQERDYLFNENRMKYQEGILWGAMMGAFGGCYSMRKEFFVPTPSSFIVDDFYITMKVLEQNGRAISELNATCNEDVSNKVSEEFRRKTRIAKGNFQNLGRFSNLLSPSKGTVAFAFWSHKVLRWMGPFLLIITYFSSFVLSFNSDFFKACCWMQTLLFAVPLLDATLRKLNIHFSGLRYIAHFYVMNAALLNGFFNYLTGVKNNVWKPTERNQ
ncbi:MAG: glycosyltransferase [Chitinophagales bacterium]